MLTKFYKFFTATIRTKLAAMQQKPHKVLPLPKHVATLPCEIWVFKMLPIWMKMNTKNLSDII